MNVKEWNRKLGFDVDKVSYATSFITIGILGALFLLFLIWTAAIVRKRARFVTGFYGTIFTFVGLIVFLTGLAIVVGQRLHIHTECMLLSGREPAAAILGNAHCNRCSGAHHRLPVPKDKEES